MTNVLEERYRSLLRILPADYRAEWEEEMVATYLQGMATDDEEIAEYLAEFGRPAWSDWETRAHDDMLATLLDPAGEGAGLVSHSALFRRRVFERVG